ncbi:hypothetical protein [Actinotalea subterranea]|uniref:hypothetical protein n=1 Tax=Actinotalea subterranea TaxID=2607497 RepID=UPI0011EE3B86|nr:hypothetical protein [Actinotalea subterranea]
MTTTDNPGTGVDEELSAAVVTYFSRGRSSFPKHDPEAVVALAAAWPADALLAAVRALEAEVNAVPIDWSTTDLAGAWHQTSAVMAERHPELTPHAVETLSWAFTYAWR